MIFVTFVTRKGGRDLFDPDAGATPKIGKKDPLGTPSTAFVFTDPQSWLKGVDSSGSPAALPLL